MSATEEQLDMISRNGMDVSAILKVSSQKGLTSRRLQHATYIVIMFCMAFIIYLWSNLLISLFHNSGRNAPKSTSPDSLTRPESSLWRMLVDGAKGHYNNSSREDKLDDYAALPNSARTGYDDSIELGNRRAYSTANGGPGRNTASHPGAAVAVFYANLDAASSDNEDDGGDSYWTQPDLDDEGGVGDVECGSI